MIGFVDDEKPSEGDAKTLKIAGAFPQHLPPALEAGPGTELVVRIG